MILRQFLHFDPVGASDLLGCDGKASAAVIDPIGPVEPYLEAAATTGMKRLYVIDTHIHADHISSGRILAEASGVKYVLFAGASWRPKDRFCCAEAAWTQGVSLRPMSSTERPEAPWMPWRRHQ